MPDPAIHTLLRAWSLSDMAARREAMAPLLAADLDYLDPHFPDPVVGANAYLDFVDEVIRRYPRIAFTRLNHSSHHGVGLIDWRLQLEAASPASFGSFFYDLSPTGQLIRLVGFVRPSPS